MLNPVEQRRLVKTNHIREKVCFRCWKQIPPKRMFYREYRPEFPRGYFRGLQFCRECFDEFGQELLNMDYGMTDTQRAAKKLTKVKAEFDSRQQKLFGQQSADS